MLTRRAALAVLAAVPFVVCSGCDDELAMYYPLAPGLTWRYRVLLAQNSGAAGDTAVVTNLKPVMLFGRTLVPQRSELFGQTVVRYLAHTQAGVVQFAQQAGQNPPVARDPPDYLLRVPVTVGTSWSSTWESTRGGTHVLFPTVKTIAGTRDTIMVPAGTLADCLHMKIAGKAEVALPTGPVTIEVAGDEWYAPRIGFIKGAFREVVNQGQATSDLSMSLEIFDGGL